MVTGKGTDILDNPSLANRARRKLITRKIFTEPDLNKKSKLKIPPKIYARALDNILVAMKGKRIFERFGFNLPEQPQQTSSTKLVVNFETWTFPKDSSDWVNVETGEALTGFAAFGLIVFVK